MITIALSQRDWGLERASCEVDGVPFSADSRNGSIHALCRKLLEADVPDQPWEVPGRIKGTSIAWMADHSISEVSGQARTVRYRPGSSDGLAPPIASEAPEASGQPPAA